MNALAAARTADSGREALRHILDTGASAPTFPDSAPIPRAEDGAIYREVSGRFSEAMDQLSRMAASAGVWTWGERAGEGAPYLFMRLMAAFGVGPCGEGVDLRALLHDVHDHWERLDILISLPGERVLVPVERAFNLARALQAILEGFLGHKRRAPATLSLKASVAPSGLIRLTFHGPKDFFPDGDPVFSSREACALAELARAGVASVLFARNEAVAELRVSV